MLFAHIDGRWRWYFTPGEVTVQQSVSTRALFDPALSLPWSRGMRNKNSQLYEIGSDCVYHQECAQKNASCLFKGAARCALGACAGQ